MDAHTCNHPLVPHTVSWWLDDTTPPTFAGRDFPDLESADIFAQKIIRQNRDRTGGLRIHRSDNEAYVCFSWENKEDTPVETQKVKLEVDMEPLKEAFENVALGFKNQGRSITRLWAVQGITAGLVIFDLITRLF